MPRPLAVLAVVAAIAACNPDGKRVEPGPVGNAPAGTAATPAQPAPAPAAAPAPTESAAPLTEAEVAAIGDRMLAVMEQVVTAVEASSADCEAMASAIEKVAADNRPALDELRASNTGTTNDALFDAWMAKNQARAAGLANRLAAPLNTCASDVRLATALGKLER